MAITGTGYALGDEFLDNAALAERHAIRIKPSFIKNSIGTNSRYFLSEGRSTSDIATEAAKQALSKTVSLVDKMATKGIIHKNTAGRYKSRLASRLKKAA